MRDIKYWVDTHCHLDYPGIVERIDEVILEAKAVDVLKMITIGTKLLEVEKMEQVVEKYPEYVRYTIGQHPCETSLNGQQVFEYIERYLQQRNENILHEKNLQTRLQTRLQTKPAMNHTVMNHDSNMLCDKIIGQNLVDDKLVGDKIIVEKLVGNKLVDDKLVGNKLVGNKLVGLGETGLDKNNENLILQKEVFHAHLDLSVKYDLPVVVHSREMDEELLISLKEFPNARGVLHCWTGSKDTAMKAVDLGWIISFSGIITFAKKVEYLHDIVKALPLDRIVIETDAPFLAPQKYRGKKNEPSYIIETAHKIAQLREIDIDLLQDALLLNSSELFALD